MRHICQLLSQHFLARVLHLDRLAFHLFVADFEGRPDVAEEIAAPYMETRAATLPAIDYDRMLDDLDMVQRIMDLYIELDDEEVLALL